MEYRLLVPDLGMGAEPIRLSTWLVRRGARVASGGPVAEILCGPATVDLPSPADGVLAEKIVGEGETVRPGEVIAVIRGA